MDASTPLVAKLIGEWKTPIEEEAVKAANSDDNQFDRFITLFANEIEREVRHRDHRVAQAMSQIIDRGIDLSTRHIDQIEELTKGSG